MDEDSIYIDEQGVCDPDADHKESVADCRSLSTNGHIGQLFLVIPRYI